MTNMYNPNGATFHNKLPMKSMDRLKIIDTIEDIGRYKIDYSLGTYYPPRCTPSIAVNIDSELPSVMCAGDIITIKEVLPASAYNSAGDGECGILISGDVAVSQRVDDGSVMKTSLDLLYPRDMSGFIVKANGGESVDEFYTQRDVDYGILTASGETPVVGTDYYTRSANVPFGIVAQRVNSDMKHRYLNYDNKTSGYSIMPAGVITLPVVMINFSGDSVGGTDAGSHNFNNLSAINAIERSLNDNHQYVIFKAMINSTGDGDVIDSRTLVKTGTKLKPTKLGKFTNFVEGKDHQDQYFGKILERRLRVPYDMRTVEDSFPGSQIPGMDTAGLSKRIYTFMKTVLSTVGTVDTSGNSYTPSKEELRQNLYNAKEYKTSLSGFTVSFSNVDVVFGYLAK